jgi:hypothetical protein
MYYNQYINAKNNRYQSDNNANNNNQQMNSYVRVLHAAPNAPSVDIYANGSLIINDLAYKEYSDYLPIPSNNYNIKLYPVGQMNTPVIDTNIFVPANTVFTIAAIGTLPNLSLFPIQEPPNGQNSGNACVRFIHLSPNAPNVDIKLPDGSTVFSNVGYKNISTYTCVPGGSYSFIVTPTGTDTEVLTVPDVPLEENNFYSIYAVGLVGESPTLEALLLPEPRYS